MTPTVDIQGAADLMKIHPKSVQDKIAAGELPAAKVGRAYVLMTRDVLEYVEREIVKQTAQRLARRQAGGEVTSRRRSQPRTRIVPPKKDGK